MVKKLLLVLLFLFTFCLTVFAETGDRWQWVHSTDYVSYYMDADTVLYNKNDGVGTVWIKEVGVDAAEGTYSLNRYEFAYDKGVSRPIGYVYYRNGQLVRQNYTVYNYSYVPPDSWREKVANIIADKYGRPHILARVPDSWIWVKSTDRVSIYVGSDTIEYDLANQRCYVWALYKDLKNHEHASRYVCDFATGQMGYSNYSGKVVMRTIVPDTEQEAVYNGAKRLYDNYAKNGRA